MPTKGIVAQRPKFESETKSSKFPPQCWRTARFKGKFPSLTVIQTGSKHQGSPNRITKGLQIGMRIKKSLRHHGADHLHKEIFRTKEHHRDVYKTNFIRGCVPSKVNSLSIHSKGMVYIIDRDECDSQAKILDTDSQWHGGPQIPKQKSTSRSSALFCWYMWWRMLRSVLSLGRPWNRANFCSFVAGRRFSRDYPEEKRVIEWSIENFVSTVAVTKHGVAPYIESSPAKGNLEQRTDVEDTMLEPVTKGFKEGNASSSMPRAGGNPMRRVEEKTL